MVTDTKNEVLLCTTCGTLTESEGEPSRCPVCGSTVTARRYESLARTWALTVTALILYVPANIYPMMDVQIFGVSTKSTILEGTIKFYQHEMYFICAVVFVASFVVPLFKISALFYLLISVKKKGLSSLQKTRLFHTIEIIGKWSMLDVFVVAVMSGLISSGYMANIKAEVGIVFFALVVLLTMKASASFDTRLLWDSGD